MRLYIILIIAIISTSLSKAQDSTKFYNDAYMIIDSMLNGKTQLNFKKAVLATENAYLDGQLNFNSFNKEIAILKKLTKAVTSSNLIVYDEPDKNNIEFQASIFKLLTDTIPIIIDSTHIFFHTPYTYDFEDMWGQEDWTKMFVSKLLITGKGNCHSLPFLYKILAEEFEIPAYLSFAPNHIYIKSHCLKTGWYNTELTSATFPIDAWIMASGYVNLDAIRNGLYMDTLSMQQSVAYCLIDLAQGYQHKFGKTDPRFVVKCCNKTLQYHTVNVNALLTKAEAQKNYIELKMKSQNIKNPTEMLANDSITAMYLNMEQAYVQLHQLGYRRMPEEMYVQWMGLLKTEQKKYLDERFIPKFDNQ